MPNPDLLRQVAIQLVLEWERLYDRKTGHILDYEDEHLPLVQIITAALLAEGQRVRIQTLKDASDRGYLTHRDDCRKGTTSETCTCDLMRWLPDDAKS